MTDVGSVIVQIRSADAAIFHAQDHIIRPRRGIGRHIDDEWLGHFLKDCGAHVFPRLDSVARSLCHRRRTATENPMTDLYATARQMLADLNAKRISARELLDAHVARNDALAKTINRRHRHPISTALAKTRTPSTMGARKG